MNIISYIRVSTQRQGDSGLGLEAQEAAIRSYAGTQHEVLAQYREIESGKNCKRPQLAAALAHCRRANATLVVAKLDRLARNVAFLAKLMEANTPFVACDNPNANRLTLHILSAVSEAEAEAISARTKAALQAYKARGGILGRRPEQGTGFTVEQRMAGSRLGGRAMKENAIEDYASVVSDVARMRSHGCTLSEIAARLNAGGHRTRQNKLWNPKQVSRVLDLASVENYPCLTR